MRLSSTANLGPLDVAKQIGKEFSAPFRFFFFFFTFRVAVLERASRDMGQVQVLWEGIPRFSLSNLHKGLVYVA